MSVSLQYDAAGNVTDDGNNTYLYDAEGHICAVRHEVVSGLSTMTQYLYDAEGHRVAKGSIASWSCDTSANGFTPQSVYVLGPSGEQMTEMRYDAGTWKWQHTNVEAGGLSATYVNDGVSSAAGSVYFHLSDWLGTRRQQVDYAGNPMLNFSSQPYGDGLQQDAVGSAAVPDATEHHFTGKERDSESGNDYFGARYYASTMGRFMSPDPTFQSALSANPQTWNRYTYGLNNPLTIIDPNGEVWQYSMSGTWDWMKYCNIGATCVDQIAQQEGNNVTTYGPSGPNDKQSFAANKNGYVNVADIAKTDGAYFEFQSGVSATYASPETAVNLYNGAFDYHQDYPNDGKLSLNDIGKVDGSGFSPHKTHNLGRAVDMAYMGADGQPIHKGNLSVLLADDARMADLISIFKGNGFNQNYSDNNVGYHVSWAPGHMTHIHFGKTAHLAQCEIGPCK